MNHLKTDPVGIDRVIDRIQKAIYAPLLASWETLDVYGRVYKNQKKKGVQLEVYNSNGDYDKILFSEGNKVFFVQGDSPKSRIGTMENDLWVISILDLDKVRPDITHRADEEVHSDMLNALYTEIKIEDVDSLEYGMENLKKVVEDTLSFGDFDHSDIHPYHVFMVKLKVKYYLENINC